MSSNYCLLVCADLNHQLAAPTQTPVSTTLTLTNVLRQFPVSMVMAWPDQSRTNVSKQGSVVVSWAPHRFPTITEGVLSFFLEMTLTYLTAPTRTLDICKSGNNVSISFQNFKVFFFLKRTFRFVSVKVKIQMSRLLCFIVFSFKRLPKHVLTS